MCGDCSRLQVMIVRGRHINERQSGGISIDSINYIIGDGNKPYVNGMGIQGVVLRCL